MAMSDGMHYKNGFASKILAGILVALITTGVVGIWNMRYEVAQIAEALSGIDRRVQRLEAITDRGQDRRFYWPDIPSAR